VRLVSAMISSSLRASCPRLDQDLTVVELERGDPAERVALPVRVIAALVD
jgi:hypothetical protein